MHRDVVACPLCLTSKTMNSWYNVYFDTCRYNYSANEEK